MEEKTFGLIMILAESVLLVIVLAIFFFGYMHPILLVLFLIDIAIGLESIYCHHIKEHKKKRNDTS